MIDDKRNSLTADQTEPDQLPDLPDPELPDLTRLYKRRCRDGDIMQKCKHLLIAGMLPGKVALLLRLPLEKVQNLYDNSYNPRCRRFAKTNVYTNTRLALTSFLEGASLSDICIALGLPLFTIVKMLRENGITAPAINARMPPVDDPLTIEYKRVCDRKATTKFKPIRLHSNRYKLHPTTAAITQQTSIQQASQQATA